MNLHRFNAEPQRFQYGGCNVVGDEARVKIHAIGRAVGDETVRQGHGPEFEAVIESAVAREECHHLGGETSQGWFLDGQQYFMVAAMACW